MGRKVPLVMGLLCLAAAGGAGYLAWLRPLAPAPPGPAPGLVADPPVRDFGVLNQHETIDAEFRILNHYPHRVIVAGLGGSCGCANPTMTPTALGPGESGTLRVTWRTGTKRGPTTDTVTLSYAPADGGEQVAGLLTVRLRAEVVPDVACDPEEIEFVAGTPGRVVVRFRSARGDAPLRLLSAYPTHAAFAVKLVPERAEVEVTYDPATPGWDDAPRLHLTVQTSSLREPTVVVPIRVSSVAGGDPAAQARDGKEF